MGKQKDQTTADGLVEVRYDGPSDVLEVTADGVTIPRGGTGRVSVDSAAYLLGCTFADVVAVSGNAPSVWPGTHAKLDGLADTFDVEWPETQNGHQPMTVADKVAYLEAAGYSPDGTNTEPKDEVTVNTETQKEGD